MKKIIILIILVIALAVLEFLPYFSIDGEFLVFLRIAGLILVLGISFLVFLALRRMEKKKDLDSQMFEKLVAERGEEQTILASIGEGIYGVDRDRKIVLFNRKAEEMTGYTAADVIGKDCSSVMKIKNREGVNICKEDCPVIRSWEQGETIVTDDLIITKKDRNSLKAFTTVSPIKDYKGIIKGGITVFRDRGEEAELEDQKREFISIVAHELRTPVAIIESNLSTLAQENLVLKDLNPKTVQILNQISLGSKRLARLIGVILSIFEIERGKLTLDLKPVIVENIIKEVVTELNPALSAKKLAFKLVLDSKTRIVTDKNMVKEVLISLVDNAIKFTKKGEITVGVTESEEIVKIFVKDTGIGIKKEDFPKIFKKFYQVESYLTRDIQGAGIGLYFAKIIVEMLEGKIWVESKVGKGSKFSFSLPKKL